MTDQLRGLLEQAVPDDAPTLDPNAVAAAARRSRSRSRAGLAGVAALVLVGGVTTFAALDRRGDDSGQVADDGSSAPYDAPGCPTTLPELADATTSVDSLDALASVRMCPDLAPTGLTTDPPPPSEQKAILAGMDALVEGTAGFADRVAATEPFDAARCAALDVFNTRQSLQLTYDGGRSVLVPTGACLPIAVAGHQVDGQYLGEAFLAALDHQRSNVDYTYHGEVPLSCDSPSTPSPARPGRDRVVAAIACGADGSRAPLTDHQLRLLAEAWDDPEPAREPTECQPRTDLPVLVLATDRGDRVTVHQERCDRLSPGLAWPIHDLPDGVVLRTTMADLGLTP